MVGMDSLGQAAGRRIMQRLVTGFRCEKKGCFEQAEWYVSLNTRAFHWCGKHVVLQMEDKRFWQMEVAPKAVRSR
jgi:hypothetical protein